MVAPVSHLRTVQEDGVLTIAFDRPDKLNALRAVDVDAFAHALAKAAADSSVRCVVVTGTGRAFTAGQDLAELDAMMRDGSMDASRRRIDALQELTMRIIDHPKPIVAAVNGIAVGFGSELLCACDYRIAARDAWIAFVGVSTAMVETNGVLWLLPRIVGHAAAADLLLTGRRITASDALRLGLVQDVVPAADLATRAMTMARELGSRSPLAVRLTRTMLRATWQHSLAEIMRQEADAMAACIEGPDLGRATRQFLER
jgi:enoyl-CoA hydratase/carnithine racemase